jgi:glycerophosphoryl diester phosphodiesterase
MKTPLIIAHRGASGDAPENTLAAFRLAIESGADMIELDLHQSKDGTLVVCHDSNLYRTAHVKKTIKQLTLKELKKLDVGYWFHPRFSGETIPTLEEVLILTKDRIRLNIEIKQGSSLYPGIEKSLIELLESCGMIASALISSFDHAALDAVRALNSTVDIGLLAERGDIKHLIRKAAGPSASSLNLYTKIATPESVQAAHHHKLEVYVYTVNQVRLMNYYFLMSVDGLFTNFPGRMAQLLKRQKNINGFIQA